MSYGTDFGSSINTALTKPKITDAEFIKLTVNNAIGSPFCFSTSFKNETVGSTSTQAYTALGGFVSVSGHQRDLQVTSYDTMITLVGIDSSKLRNVLEISTQGGTGSTGHAGLKGSQIEIYRGFYDDTYALIDTPQLRYTGIVTSYTINEDRQEQLDTFTLAIHCSSNKTVLENRIVGRYTNDASWSYINPDDTSMNRVAAINKQTFNFGQKLA